MGRHNQLPQPERRGLSVRAKIGAAALVVVAVGGGAYLANKGGEKAPVPQGPSQEQLTNELALDSAKKIGFLLTAKELSPGLQREVGPDGVAITGRSESGSYINIEAVRNVADHKVDYKLSDSFSADPRSQGEVLEFSVDASENSPLLTGDMTTKEIQQINTAEITPHGLTLRLAGDEMHDDIGAVRAHVDDLTQTIAGELHVQFPPN
jgi:hypothetical protein